MQQHNIHNFLERYFETNECQILENDAGYMNVQLTIDLDKQLMNRPFYWHYLEKTDGTPNPMSLTLITDQNKAPDGIKGEVIHFGSPRLHQVFQSTKELASYIRMYEQIQQTDQNRNVPLHPWLSLNTKISYQCDRKKDHIVSLGLNLINGTILDRFHERTLQLNLSPKIPDFSFTISPLIKPKSGLNRLQNWIEKHVENDNHTWADEARIRWKQDKDLLDHFYEELDDKPESFHVEQRALQEQYEPKISVSIINGGLFYVTQQAFL